MAVSNVSGDAFITDGYYHVIRRVSAAGDVTTIGVCGARGYVDGALDIARFNNPFATAIDSAHDRLYISDNNNLIRVLDNLRGNIVVSTVCGLPQGGSAIDGVGTASRFNNVYGLALDPVKQILYASDYNNQRIRKVDLATGTVTTIAGSSAAGAPPSNAVGTDIRFGNPTGVALDPTFTRLYIGDWNNAVIHVLELGSLQSSVFAGDGDLTNGVVEGVGNAAKLPFVSGLAVDPVSGDLFATLNIDATVVKITRATATVSIFTGVSRSVDGRGLNARFGHISSMVVDASDNLIVADAKANTIRRISTSTGAVVTIAGLANSQGAPRVDGAATAARFHRPTGVALGADGTSLYIADSLNRAIRLLNLATMVVSTAAGGNGGGLADGAALTEAQLTYPAQLVVALDKTVFFTDCVNLNMRYYTAAPRTGDKLRMLRDGVVTTLGDSAGADFFNFGMGMSQLAIEQSTGFVYISDFWHQRIHKWAPYGGPRGTFSYVAQPGYPTGLAFDNAGKVFGSVPGALLVSRWGSWALLRYNMPSAANNPPAGDTPVVGMGDAFGNFNPGSHDGLFGNASAFQGAAALQPGAIAIDSKGDIFVAHAQHNKVLRIGRLQGAACSFAVPADDKAHACHPGTYIDWAGMTCRQCPPSASLDVFSFSSYCQDPLGAVITTGGDLSAATTAGISVGAVAGGVTVVLALLAARAYYVINQREAPQKRRGGKPPRPAGTSPRAVKRQAQAYDEHDGSTFSAVGVRAGRAQV